MNKNESHIETLEREGWTRQFTASEPRLSEAVALYEATGYEVHLEPFVVEPAPSDFPITGNKCTTCYEGAEDQYKIIFTRKKADGPLPVDDLFE
ncbi:MAG: hypothetical protein RBT11_19555 [Desulfobacterales bacterium]|jgi:hypothetical protein|nr:hypothetical protein [Desulfobacterales bacterium]